MPRFTKKKASSSTRPAKKIVLKEDDEYSSAKAREHLFARVIPHTDVSHRAAAAESGDNIPTERTTSEIPADRPFQTRSRRSSAVTLSTFSRPLDGSYHTKESVQSSSYRTRERVQPPQVLNNEEMVPYSFGSPFLSQSYRVSEDTLHDDFYISRPSYQRQQEDCDEAQPELTVLRTTTRLYQVHKQPGTAHFYGESQEGRGKKPQGSAQYAHEHEHELFSEQHGREEFTFMPSASQRGRFSDYQGRYMSRVGEVIDPGEIIGQEADTRDDTNDLEHPDYPEQADYSRQPEYRRQSDSTEGMQPRVTGVKRGRSEVDDEDSDEGFWPGVQSRMLKKQSQLNLRPYKRPQYCHEDTFRKY